MSDAVKSVEVSVDTTFAPALVVVEDRAGHDGPATGGHYGEWARVWTSNKDGISVTIAEEKHDVTPGSRLKYHHDHIVVAITPNESFGPDDYVVIERKFSSNPNSKPTGNKESFELLFGKMPLWANFPEAWQKWVNGMREEAVKFLETLEPYGAGSPLNKHAYQHSLELAVGSKKKTRTAWEEVQDILKDRGILKYEPRHTMTWTGTQAMPVKIAKACGWTPSIPQPKWEEPNKSGRILIADHNGPVKFTEEVTAEVVNESVSPQETSSEPEERRVPEVSVTVED